MTAGCQDRCGGRATPYNPVVSVPTPSPLPSARAAAPRPGGRARAVLAFALTVVFAFMVSASGAGHLFLTSLRIQKPQPVNVNIPSFSGPNANRQLLEMVGGMVSKQVKAALDEKDQPAADPAAASKLAGFTAALPTARKDAPTLVVMGAHAIDGAVDRAQLHTMLVQAGRPNATLPASLDGAPFTVRTPRAVRAQYGNCPVPVAATLQNQIQGPPPPTTDNGNCIVLIQGPPASAAVPAGLDLGALVEIGLELSGMSPNQSAAFQKVLDAKSTLVLSMPRGMRSYAEVDLAGAKGILVNTAGRRGPTYSLVWTKNGIVYALVGYGSPGDAVPLANSLH